MAQQKPSSASYWRTQGGALELTTTFNSSGAGTSRIVGNQIFIDVTATLTAEAAAIAVTCPIDIRVTDVKAIRNGGGNSTLDILNGVGGTSITGGAMAATAGDTDLVRATEMDDAAYDVDAGTILSVTCGSATFLGLIIIDFMPTN